MSIEAMKRIVAAVEAIPEDIEGWMPDALTDALIDARQAIAVYESAPPECQTEAEKTAFAFGWWKAMETKREWVGLTDEQIISKAIHLSGLGTSPDVLQFARAIEAAHGIKENT